MLNWERLGQFGGCGFGVGGYWGWGGVWGWGIVFLGYVAGIFGDRKICDRKICDRNFSVTGIYVRGKFL